LTMKLELMINNGIFGQRESQESQLNQAKLLMQALLSTPLIHVDIRRFYAVG